MTEQTKQPPRELRMWHPESSRKIVARYVITGTLTLETPAHFGSGDDDGPFIPLLTDSADEKSPVLPGASVVGALRSYLWAREEGYGKQQVATGGWAERLFGGTKADAEGEPSRVIIRDAVGTVGAGGNVFRDGVSLNPATRTADGKLYNFALWPKGTTFPLHIELVVLDGDDDNGTKLLGALCTALNGLITGEITLGARKKRGYGRAVLTGSSVQKYDMKNADHLVAWLKGQPGEAFTIYSEMLLRPDEDKRAYATLEATFAIDGSLLIRAASDSSDMAHLGFAEGDGKAILSGTSLAGALRARVRAIANTLGKDGAVLVNGLFGSGHDEKDGKAEKCGSRISVEECVITGGVNTLVQSRVSIDRFTGGALDTALFDQQPQFGGTFTMKLRVRNATQADVGLLLLLLKDLWTGDLPLGGERSVGRGRLMGQSATLIVQNVAGMKGEYSFGNLTEGDRNALESAVGAFMNATTVKGG